jgi:hypothetical protein
MKEHLDAAERQRGVSLAAEAAGPLTFGKARKTYKERLEAVAIRLTEYQGIPAGRPETRAAILG